MQKKKSNKKKTLILLILILIIVVLMVTCLNKKNQEYKGTVIDGTFVYNEDIKYEFDEHGKGVMHDGEDEYAFSYSINEQKLLIDFKNELLHDATYTFQLSDDILTLIGGEGTLGGEYILKKE